MQNRSAESALLGELEQGDESGSSDGELAGASRREALLFNLYESDESDDDGPAPCPAKVEQGHSVACDFRCLFTEKEQVHVDGAHVSPAQYEYTWNDLSPEAQEQARQKACSEYYDWGCWRLDVEPRPWKELKAEKVEVLAADYRGHRAKWDENGNLIGRLRWTPKGFHEFERPKESYVSPTAHKTTHRTLDGLGKQRRMRRFRLDIRSAFFQQDPMDESEVVWTELPPEDPAQIPGQRMCRRLAKWVPGTKSAPRGWFDTVAQELTGAGWVQSKLDPCAFYWRKPLESCSPCFAIEGQHDACVAYLPLHVDDAMGRVEWELSDELERGLRALFELGEFEWVDSGSVTFTGITEEEHEDFVDSHQLDYIKTIQQVPLDKHRARHRDAVATEAEVSAFRGALGQCQWAVLNTRQDCAFETSTAASKCNRLKIGDIVRLNKVIRHLQVTPTVTRRPRLPPGHVKVVAITDVGEGEQAKDDYSKAQGGRLVGLMLDQPSPGPGPIWVVEIRSGKCARVTHGSFDGECIEAVAGLDAGLAVAMLVEEFYFGPTPSMRERASTAITARPKTMAELHTDSKSLTTHVASVRVAPNLAKRRKQDVADVKEAVNLGDIYAPVFILGPFNPVDAITKDRSRTTKTGKELLRILSTGFYDPPLG